MLITKHENNKRKRKLEEIYSVGLCCDIYLKIDQ